MNFFILIISSLFLVQCASLSSKEKFQIKYNNYIEKRTRKKQSYSGWNNNYSIRLSLLDTKLQNLQNRFRSYQFQWSNDEETSQKKTLNKKLTHYTEAFMSFYAPNPKNNKLEQKSTSLWKIFLDIDGRRFEGKIKKMSKLRDEIITYYPFHSRWGTPYIITFSAPTSLVDNYKARIIMTGPLGTVELPFSPIEDR